MAFAEPAKPNDLLSSVDTPALCVDMTAFDSNLKSMKSFLNKYYPNVNLRPHAKAHKTPEIGHKQIIEGGAVGLCCQKMCELEAMVDGGIKNILLSNEVVGDKKIKQLVEYSKRADLTVCVDNIANCQDLNKECERANIHLKVIVEVNVGQDRCGVEPGLPVSVLAKAIQHSCPHLVFKGIQVYQGANQHVREYADRKKCVDSVIAKVQDSLDALKAENIACDIVTGGGTGTFQFESASGLYNEVQPGSYVFMDADYCRNQMEGPGSPPLFEHSLFVLATVMSVAADGSRAVVDAGMKAVSLDSGVPAVHSVIRRHGSAALASPTHPLAHWEYTPGGDEHGILKPTATNPESNRRN